MDSARKSDLAGIRQIMGPISARVPLMICIFPNLPIEILMRDIETQFSSTIGFEHCALKALSEVCGFQNMRQQAAFSWNPPGTDLSPKRIVCHDKEVAPAVLAYREDLSVLFSHDYGLLFEVYEHGEHITIYASWDRALVSVDLIARLLEQFGSLLISIIKTPRATVLELLSEYRTSQAGQVAGIQPREAGLPPEQLLNR